MVDDVADITTTTEQFVKKIKLISNIHENVLLNVEHAQKKQNTIYATRKGK
jgi:hypothetical protein